jgi:uncharacterized membrane protein
VRETDRVEAFSDGVMAVIITLMAFNVKPPGGTTWTAVRGDLPELLVYVLSFAIVGTYWNNHHHLFRATDHISAAVMWSNLHLLFWLSLLPIATGWVGRSRRGPGFRSAGRILCSVRRGRDHVVCSRPTPGA